MDRKCANTLILNERSECNAVNRVAGVCLLASAGKCTFTNKTWFKKNWRPMFQSNGPRAHYVFMYAGICKWKQHFPSATYMHAGPLVTCLTMWYTYDTRRSRHLTRRNEWIDRSRLVHTIDLARLTNWGRFEKTLDIRCCVQCCWVPVSLRIWMNENRWISALFVQLNNVIVWG